MTLTVARASYRAVRNVWPLDGFDQELQVVARQRKAWISRGFAVTLVAALLSLLGTSGAAAQPAVSVFPSPNTTYALPQTQITFRGIPASQIGSFTVVGSSSGSHSGTIQADSDGQGGSWIPDQPFTAGETVTVTTGLNVVGGSNGSWHFGIATPFGTINPMKIPMVAAGSNGVQHFHTRPDLQPASITVNKRSSATYNGDIFLTPQFGPLQDGPMLLDPSGNLLWFQPLPANQLATDFRVQQYQGQPVLTWWQGYTNNGSGRGEGVIYNTSYQQIATVQAGNGIQGMDLHEFLVTPQGDAYIVGVSPVRYPGLSRPLMDSVVQEIDIKTGLVLFEWHALDHIPLSASFFNTSAKGYVYDPYHLNSVSLDNDGNLIVSLRNTWAVYKIDHSTGAVIWTLGSSLGNFKHLGASNTAFQHNALVQPDGSITMFDDGGGPPTLRAGRGVRVSINTSNNTVSLLNQYIHTPALNTNFEGNVQLLPNGDVFVGWGQQPYFTEFSASGQELFDARFTSNTSSYRAYRLPWSGQPATPPASAVQNNNDATTEVYSSWNGATSVASWRVLAGPNANSLSPLMTVGWRGFETAAAASTGVPDFAVQALDSGGHILGTSGVSVAPPHIGIAGRSAFVSSTGVGGLPAICTSTKTCHVTTTIFAGRTVIARTGSEQVPAQGSGLIYFTLTRTGRSLLAHARRHRLLVWVSGQDSASGLKLGRFITLAPFSTSGRAPARSASQSRSLRILGLTDFVSSGNVGGILAQCAAASPCHTTTTLSVGKTVIASTGSELLGGRDVGYLIFTLTPAGRSLLAHARGNQLSAAVTISDGDATARGEISLVRFR